MILGQFNMLNKINLTSKIFMVEGGEKIKIKFYFHFVVFLRGGLEKQVIIKVWP
jgi:hypothetical protein